MYNCKYFVVFKGDDTDFTGNQKFVIELQTELDLTGMSAHFRFLDFAQDFDSIPEDKKLEIVIPATSTSKFPLGTADAKIWLLDSNGKKRTVSNRIHFVVTNSVREAYDNDDPQAITVTIASGSGGVDPTKILDGVTMETNTIVKMRNAIHTIGTALGATVTALAMMVLPCRAATNTIVHTVDIRNVDLDNPVEIVTNVDCEALVDTNQLHVAVTNLEEQISKATPDNYSVVADAATNALSRAEAEAGFTEWTLRGIPSGATNIQGPNFESDEGGLWCHLGFTYNGVEYNSWPYVDSESVTLVEFDCTDDLDTTSYPVTATRMRLPTMEDISAMASTNYVNDGFLPIIWDDEEHISAVIEPALVFTSNIYSYEGWEMYGTVTFGGIVNMYDDIYINNWDNLRNSESQTLPQYLDQREASITNAVIAATETNAAQSAVLSDIASTVGINTANLTTLGSQVNAIGSHLNAEDARFVSTNYDSVTRIPEAYVEIRLNDHGTNKWVEIWHEMRRWTAFVGDAFDWNTWSGFHAWATNITAELSFKADRAWGAYDSETGKYSPEGYTQISSSNILIASGMAYQRTVTSDGAVWVLQCNSGVAQIGGDTNGYFRIMDADGNTQFEVIKGDRREMGADASGITVSGNVMTIPYSVEADEHPIIQCTANLSAPNWKDETDASCPCTVIWSGSSGEWVATVTPKTASPSMFVKATYMAGGETYINNVAPVSISTLYLNGTKYYLGTATIDGHTVLTLSTTAP